MSGMFSKVVGLQAEDNFEAVLYQWRVRSVHCPNGEDPGVPFAYERATGREDRNGVDFWVWLACVGRWIPVDLTIANGNSRSGYLARKNHKANRRGVVVVQLRKASLELAAKGASRYLKYVCDDFKAAVREQLPKIGDRLLTREKIANHRRAVKSTFR